MSEMKQMERHFSGGSDAPELEDYRPISPLVIGSCIAGLASLLAVLHPLLWVVPAVAAILSVCAIVRVSSAQSLYGGRKAAVAALCLAALIGSYAPARALSRDRALFAEASEKTVEWLSLLQQGRVQEAHQLSEQSHDRFQGPASLASHYADAPSTKSLSEPTAAMEGFAEMGPSPAEQIKEFAAMPVIAKLLELGEQSRIEHLQNVEKKSAQGDVKITQRYRVSGVHDGQPESIEFLIRAMRHEVGQVASWSVGNLELVK